MLCKPKLLPLKSITLEKLQDMAARQAEQQSLAEQQQMMPTGASEPLRR